MGTVQMLKSVGATDSAAEPTDLIAAAARGDLGAFERLYRQFSPRVYGLCLRLTGQREAAEDCTQESFVAAWRALGGFEQRSRFTTWLHRIAVHTVLARRRGLRVEYEVPEPATGLPEVADPGSGAPPLDLGLLELGVPVMGICYGMQLLVHSLGGRVEQAEVGEFGRSDLHVSDTGTLLKGMPREQTCWMSHRDTVYEAPPGFTALASSTSSPVAAVEDTERSIYGIQFHPEVVHTPYGQEILTRFLTEVCGCEPTWSAASIVEEQIRRIREQVGDGNVICGLSGGVDSSVAALLVHRAVGEQLTCVFVDHGLMRKDEGEQVVKTFRDTFKVPLVAVDAETRFLDKLKGVTEPEAKRKAIGAEFIRVFEEEAEKLVGSGGGDSAAFLVQGTLYSDVIESGGGTGTATIKSHHNVGGLPEDLEFELVEPLRSLFKDEVRAVGAELGLPERLVWRQPFPGPGLAIRIVGGEATRERLDVLREADAILQDEIRKAGLYRDLWQSFCVLPDIRTVGVQGDSRTYGNVIVIRAVTSDDAMTADWARLPYDLLEQIASRMINEIRPVGRVVLDITSKPPGTIEWE